MSMFIREQENELSTRWKSYLHAHNQHFIADGVVNEAEWEAAPRKIVFLLKETNSKDYEWDEREYLNNYATAGYHTATVGKLAQWVDGAVLENKPDDWSRVEGRTASLEAKTALLRKICWVNIKKTPGKGTVVKESYEEYFAHQENRDFLREQLELYKPDLIVCCGTFDQLLMLKPTGKERITSRGIRVSHFGSVPVLDHYHPGAFMKNYLLYYSLCDAIRELRGNVECWNF